MLFIMLHKSTVSVTIMLTFIDVVHGYSSKFRFAIIKYSMDHVSIYVMCNLYMFNNFYKFSKLFKNLSTLLPFY